VTLDSKSIGALTFDNHDVWQALTLDGNPISATGNHFSKALSVVA
jgi:hypothetical protein